MYYILGKKPSTVKKFKYNMYHTIFCSHKKFHSFCFIRTVGTNEYILKLSKIVARCLNSLHILKNVFMSRVKISSNNCMDFSF